MTASPAKPLWRDDAPIRVGVSTCLLGQQVRWDAGHKRDRFLTDVLAPYFEWVPVCPEVEVGMGIPRKPVRLARGEDGEPRMLEPTSGRDWTRAVQGYAKKRLRSLALKIVHQLDGDGRARRADVVQNLQADPSGYDRAEIDDMIRRMHQKGLVESVQGPYSTVTVK